MTQIEITPIHNMRTKYVKAKWASYILDAAC